MDFFSSTNVFQGTFNDLPNGDGQFTDKFGAVVGTVTPFGDGHLIKDSLGMVTGRLQMLGDNLMYFDAHNNIVGSAQSFGHQIMQKDALGMTTGMFDPMTGNMTNAIGQLTGMVR